MKLNIKLIIEHFYHLINILNNTAQTFGSRFGVNDVKTTPILVF